MKISERGHEEYLLSEMGDDNIEDGGYVEPNRWGTFSNDPDGELV